MKYLALDDFLEHLGETAAESRHPHGATFELTYGCNLRCLHCYNPTHRALPEELATAEVCRILDEMAELGVLTVSFTGGEPAVRPDIAPILRHARDCGFVIHLLTNATRITAQFAAFLKDLGVARINVSMYGANAAVYERMTGVTGSFTAFTTGLRRLAEYALPVSIRLPVTTVNHMDVGPCRALAESYGFKFQYCLDIMPKTDGDLAPLAYRLSPEAKTTLDRTWRPSVRSSPEDACPASTDFISCACGRSRFAVTPYGEMNLCVAFPTPKYDLRTGSLREGWEMLKRTVDRARPNEHDQCPTCEVHQFCRQGRSDAWLETGDMSACLPHYKEWAQSEHRTHALLDPRRPA